MVEAHIQDVPYGDPVQAANQGRRDEIALREALDRQIGRETGRWMGGPIERGEGCRFGQG